MCFVAYRFYTAQRFSLCTTRLQVLLKVLYHRPQQATHTAIEAPQDSGASAIIGFWQHAHAQENSQSSMTIDQTHMSKYYIFHLPLSDCPIELLTETHSIRLLHWLGNCEGSVNKWSHVDCLQTPTLPPAVCTLTHRCKHTHTHTHTDTDRHTHTRTHTHTDTHTHAHTRAPYMYAAMHILQQTGIVQTQGYIVTHAYIYQSCLHATNTQYSTTIHTSIHK